MVNVSQICRHCTWQLELPGYCLPTLRRYVQRMATVRCPYCKKKIAAPDDQARATCPECGRVMSMPSTHVKTAPAPPTSGAIQTEVPANDDRLPDSQSGVYATWDDFRLTSPTVEREMMKMATRRLPDLRDVPVHTLPNDVPTAMDEWRDALGTLRIPGETQWSRWIGITALAMLGLVLSGVGIFIVLLIAIGEGNGTDPIVMSILYLFMGGVCLFFAWRLSLRRPMLALKLWIFEEGLLLQRGGELIAARFEDIQDYEVSRETGRPLFWLTLRDEAPIVLSVGHCREVLPLMEYMEIRMAGAQLLQRLKSIWDGEREKFGVVALDKEGFHGPKFFAAWTEVVRVDFDDRSMYVCCDGRADDRVIRYRDVSFPHLVLVLSKILKKERARLGPIHE